MKTESVSEQAPLPIDEAPANASVLERLAGRFARVQIAPLPLFLALAIGLTLIAGWIATALAQHYYIVAPYHFDSAFYHQQAIEYSRLREASFSQALWRSVQAKDNLDITLRLIAAPGALTKLYGHLVVLLPFMALFTFLLGWYVWRRSGSLLLGAVSTTFLFTLPLIYGAYGAPTIGGIADYWKDNIAIWLFASAALCWLLGDQLANRGWLALCGGLLGLLVMQRAVLAVYAALLFFPLVAYALYRRARAEGMRATLVQLLALAAPALLLALVVIVPQWRSLYRYYFEVGYAYGSPALVAQYLVNNLNKPVLQVVLVFFVLGSAICLASSVRPRARSAGGAALWLALGLPLAVAASSAFYFGIFSLWSLLLLVLLATLIPPIGRPHVRRLLAAGLLGLIAALAPVQYVASTQAARVGMVRDGPKRVFFKQLIDLIKAQPAPRRYGLVFREVDLLMRTQAFFDERMQLEPSVVAVYAHDSVFRAFHPGMSADQIIAQNIRDLEARVPTLALAFCQPDQVFEQSGLNAEADTLAATVIRRNSEYLRASPAWRALARLDSPYGPVCAYRYEGQQLTSAEKWRALGQRAVDEIPLAAGLSPHVQIYSYTASVPPRLQDGSYEQWLGSASLDLSVFADQDRSVELRGRAVLGRDAGGPVTLVVAVEGAPAQELAIADSQDIRVPLALRAGLNQVRISVRTDPPARGLQVRLIGPRLEDTGR